MFDLEQRIKFAKPLTVLIAYLLVIFLGYFFYWISFYITDFSVSLNQACLSLSPDSEYKSLYQSMICGSNLSHREFQQAIKALGLFHIFIISGAHLRVLYELSRKIFRSTPVLTFILLLVYIVMGQFQISALRAFSSLLIYQLNKRFKFYWNQWDILLLSILFSLSFDKTQWQSFSLILSWLACLAIIFGDNLLKKSFYCFVFIFPICSSFYPLSPLTILINASLGPIIAAFIFPACLLSLFIPYLSQVIDLIWQAIIYLCEFLKLELQWGKANLTQWQYSQYWLYCCTLHFSLKKIRKTQN